MQLYIVRHGQTDWNLENRLQGRTDIPLNHTGIKQARLLRKDILRQGLIFDSVYASPLQRTVKTAKIIAGEKASIILDNRLLERGAGAFEGQPTHVLFEHDIDFLDFDLNSNAFGVEPIQSFQARATDFLMFLQKTHPNNAKILVVTSNGLMKRLHHTIRPNSPIPNFENAHLYYYSY